MQQGLAGKRITPVMAVIGILLIWTYALGITIGPFLGRISLVISFVSILSSLFKDGVTTWLRGYSYPVLMIS